MSRSLLILPTDAVSGGPFELIAIFHFHEKIRFKCGLNVERLGLEKRCKTENHKSSRVAVRDETVAIFSAAGYGYYTHDWKYEDLGMSRKLSGTECSLSTGCSTV